MRSYNFGAGPAALPEPVIRDLQEALWDWQGQGAGIAELNHRDPALMAMMAETELLLKDVLAIPENYHIVLTPIPARAHFGLLAQNLANPGQVANYIDSGHWAQLAMHEARKYVNVAIAASSADQNYDVFPARATWQINAHAAYLHLTDNETISGVACHESLAGLPIPVVADMTSSLLMRELNIADYGMIYAGAQKNLGLSGLCVLIIRDDLLTRVDDSHIPSACHYATLAKQHSLNHTPPVLACYALNRMLHWVKAEGGVKLMERRAHDKAALIYQVLDEFPDFYRHTIDHASRSLVNITCDLPSKELTQQFLDTAKEANLIGLKGHSSRGGLRISLYNAISMDVAMVLQSFMRIFAEQHL